MSSATRYFSRGTTETDCLTEPRFKCPVSDSLVRRRALGGLLRVDVGSVGVPVAESHCENPTKSVEKAIREPGYLIIIIITIVVVVVVLVVLMT